MKNFNIFSAPKVLVIPFLFVVSYIFFKEYRQETFLKIKKIWFKIRGTLRLFNIFICRYQIVIWDIEPITHKFEYEVIKKIIKNNHKHTKQYVLKMQDIITCCFLRRFFRNKKILIISARGKIEKHLKEIIFTKDISIVGIDLGEDKVFSSDYDFSYEKEDLEGICNFFEVVLE